MQPFPQHHTDCIRAFDGALDPETCAALIRRFEADVGRQVERKTPGFSFTEINVSDCWADLHGRLFELFGAASAHYAAETGLSAWWPRHGIEKVRMKRYRADRGDAFPPHLDQHDYPTARRFLVMFLYLNTVPDGDGGETAFPQWGVEVRPHAGRVLAFPPFYPYVHEGRPLARGEKYILGSYAHYP